MASEQFSGFVAIYAAKISLDLLGTKISEQLDRDLEH
jgi:hypothetical protein